MSKITEIQRALLNRLAEGDRIQRRYRMHMGFYFQGWSPAGAELDDVAHRLGGKRALTVSTLSGLTKKGYFSYDDAGFGTWTRTAKEIE